MKQEKTQTCTGHILLKDALIFKEKTYIRGMEIGNFDMISPWFLLAFQQNPIGIYGTVDEVDIQWPLKSNQVLYSSEETEKNVNISRPWYL